MSEQPLATTEGKRPIVATDRGVVPKSLADMWRLATAILTSGMAPKAFGSPEAVVVAMQAGMEVGLTPKQAVQSIAVINGRPTMWGDACLALCIAHADFEDISEVVENDLATCVVKRRGRSDVRRTFSMADAKRAGLLGKAGPWSQYPQRMLQVRARGFALRDAFPDALRGIGIREEVQDHPQTKPLEKVRVILPGDTAEPLPPALPAPEEPKAQEGNLSKSPEIAWDAYDPEN